MDLQKDFSKALAKKELSKQERENVRRWSNGLSSPSLLTVCELSEKHNIDVIIFDGDIGKLMEFNKKVALKYGLKFTGVFE